MIPSELLLLCRPGDQVTNNLRADGTQRWYGDKAKISDLLRRHENMNVLFLELGVGATHR